jgi:hypothetical protein
MSSAGDHSAATAGRNNLKEIEDHLQVGKHVVVTE